MFKKLLSNLPFNPSLIGQVSFYAKRMHSESSLRRLGLGVLVLAMFVQMFAVFSPPEPTLANSDNDMITGGIHSREDAMQHCSNNTRQFQNILDYYGISCVDLANSSTVTLKSTDYNRQLYSMGHKAYGKAGETPVSVPNAGTLYLRYLWSWDSRASSSYTALKGTTKYGQTFFILYNCGNLVFIGLPSPPQKCPYNNGVLSNDPRCYEPCPVRGKENLPRTSPQCFETCPVQGKENLPKTSPQCFEPCPYNRSIAANNPRCYEPCPVRGKESLPRTSPQCFEPCPVNGKDSLPKTSPQCFEPCQYNPALPANSPDCKPCEASQTRDDKTACIEYRKTARNVTQNIRDANGTTARGGDVIEYTLLITNKGKAKIDKFVIEENMSDVLDYATVVNLNGGTMDEYKNVRWPAITLNGGQSVQKQITVKIKEPIPETPISTSDPGRYDMHMTNTYGNTIDIQLPPSIIKNMEITTKSLPNTGPGQSMAVVLVLTVFVAYFFARSRLFAKELDIVRSDFAANGGY